MSMEKKLKVAKRWIKPKRIKSLRYSTKVANGITRTVALKDTYAKPYTLDITRIRDVLDWAIDTGKEIEELGKQSEPKNLQFDRRYKPTEFLIEQLKELLIEQHRALVRYSQELAFIRRFCLNAQDSVDRHYYLTKGDVAVITKDLSVKALMRQTARKRILAQRQAARLKAEREKIHNLPTEEMDVSNLDRNDSP